MGIDLAKGARPMNSNVTHGFEMGTESGLEWRDIEANAAEATRDDGDVWYRGLYLCTVYNYEHGDHMTDEAVQQAIDVIDRLVAAAPDLLAACELAAALPEENFHGCKAGEAIRAARAAIAKAEGGGA